MNNDHLTGFVAGVGCTAFAFYWYVNNRERIEEFMKAQELGLQTAPGFGFPPVRAAVGANEAAAEQPIGLEELMLQKERLEDQIAELQSRLEEQMGKS